MNQNAIETKIDGRKFIFQLCFHTGIVFHITFTFKQLANYELFNWFMIIDYVAKSRHCDNLYSIYICVQVIFSISK